MKKQYIAPVMETALYEAEMIIAVSKVLQKDSSVTLQSDDILTKEDAWDIWEE